jgi:hypothetical protein
MVMGLLGAGFGNGLVIVEFQDPPLSSLTCSQAHQRLPWIGKAMLNNSREPILLLDYCLRRAFRGETYLRVITSKVSMKVT